MKILAEREDHIVRSNKEDDISHGIPRLLMVVTDPKEAEEHNEKMRLLSQNRKTEIETSRGIYK